MFGRTKTSDTETVARDDQHTQAAAYEDGYADGRVTLADEAVTPDWIRTVQGLAK